MQIHRLLWSKMESLFFLLPVSPPSSPTPKAKPLNHGEELDSKSEKNACLLVNDFLFRCETPGCPSLNRSPSEFLKTRQPDGGSPANPWVKLYREIKWCFMVSWCWQQNRGRAARSHPAGGDVANPPMPGRKGHNVERLGGFESRWMSAEMNFSPKVKQNCSLNC